MEGAYNKEVNIGKHVRLFAHIQLMPALESGEETTLVGGQAVMEGVMMRAPHSYCTAVRKPNGEVVTEQFPLHRLSEKYPIFRLPVFRGLGMLGQAMTLGVKALKFSANAALDEGKPDEKPVEITSKMMAANLAFSLLGFIVLYKFIPLFLATKLGHAVPTLGSRFAVNMSDGVIRMAMFFTFLFLLSLMPDMRRVFQYHGAEHKVVYNFESGKPVNVENAQKFTTYHPRCGTSFLFVVLGIAMITYALLPIDGFWMKFVARIALLPVIAGVSYEVIRFAARRQGTLMAVLTKPGLWLQRITTKPPDDAMAAVAIQALDGAMALEAKQGGELVIA
jgi:uncharacterized protein YqhQ